MNFMRIMHNTRYVMQTSVFLKCKSDVLLFLAALRPIQTAPTYADKWQQTLRQVLLDQFVIPVGVGQRSFSGCGMPERCRTVW